MPGGRRSPGVKLLIVGGVAVAFLTVASVVAARLTESGRFCGTDCHEMWPYRDTWAKSTHGEVECVQCHIPPGVADVVLTKLRRRARCGWTSPARSRL